MGKERSGQAMTIWAERIVDIGDWERVQNLFEEHFKALKGPREMMLICLDDDHRTARIRGGLY